MTAIIGGPAVVAAGFALAIVPVCLNAVLLVMLGIVYHRFSDHTYPHIPAAVALQSNGSPAADRPGEHSAGTPLKGIRRGLEAGDLGCLFGRSLACPGLLSELSCKDVASQDIVPIAPDDSVEAARALLLEHRLNSLLVVDLSGYLIGVVGPVELAQSGDYVSEVMSPAIWLDYNASMLDLIPLFKTDQANSVVITDDQGGIFGVVTPIDILKRTSQTRCDAADQKALQLEGGL